MLMNTRKQNAARSISRKNSPDAGRGKAAIQAAIGWVGVARDVFCHRERVGRHIDRQPRQRELRLGNPDGHVGQQHSKSAARAFTTTPLPRSPV